MCAVFKKFLAKHARDQNSSIGTGRGREWYARLLNSTPLMYAIKWKEEYDASRRPDDAHVFRQRNYVELIDLWRHLPRSIFKKNEHLFQLA